MIMHSRDLFPILCMLVYNFYGNMLGKYSGCIVVELQNSKSRSLVTFSLLFQFIFQFIYSVYFSFSLFIQTILQSQSGPPGITQALTI